MSRASDLASLTSSRDPEVGLKAVAALRRLLDQLEELHVDRARSDGWSWTEIAYALGVSKQASHEKHAARRRIRGLEG